MYLSSKTLMLWPPDKLTDQDVPKWMGTNKIPYCLICELEVRGS